MSGTTNRARHATQVDNARLLAMFGPGQSAAQEAWKQTHLSLLRRRTDPLVRAALHRHTQCKGAMAQDEARAFLTDYMVEWAFAELFHPTMRAQRMLRGVPKDRRQEAESYHLYYLVAERYLAESTPKEERVAAKEERQIAALALAASWEQSASSPICEATQRLHANQLPTDTRLEDILLRLWLYRIQEVLKAWLRGQDSREMALDLDQVRAASAATQSRPALVGQEGFDTSASSELWRRTEGLVPLVVRDRFDTFIWQRKSNASTELEIAQALSTESSRGGRTSGKNQDDEQATTPWTRGQVAGRWNALARRLRVLFQLLDQFSEWVFAPDQFEALQQAWTQTHCEGNDTIARFGRLPVETRELFGVFHKAKNPHLLWVPLHFWLDGESLQEMREDATAPGWDHIVQYWLMSRDRLATEPIEAATVIGYWSGLHRVY